MRISLHDHAKIHLLIDAAAEVDPEFGRLCRLLYWSNCRLGDALARSVRDLDTVKNRIKLKRRSAALPVSLVKDLLRSAQKDRRLFRFNKGGQIYILLQRAAEEAEIKLPAGTGFDVFRARP